MSVFLISNRNDPGNKAKKVELKEGMLSWPICSYSPVRRQATMDPIYKNALRALIGLRLFNCDFYLEVNLSSQELRFSNKCWAAIYMDNEVITVFDHNLKMNRPFKSIVEWPGIDDYEIIREWSEDQWKTFFINRIKDETLKTLTVAKCDLAAAELTMKKANDRLMERQKQTAAIMLAMENIEGSCI